MGTTPGRRLPKEQTSACSADSLGDLGPPKESAPHTLGFRVQGLPLPPQAGLFDYHVTKMVLTRRGTVGSTEISVSLNNTYTSTVSGSL